MTGRWFSPVSPTNKTDHHDITEILLKVAFNTIIKPKPTLVHILLDLVDTKSSKIVSVYLVFFIKKRTFDPFLQSLIQMYYCTFYIFMPADK